MTYTTTEKVEVEKAKFASKMDVLKQTAEVEKEYEDATCAQREIRDEKFAYIKAATKDALTTAITDALETLRAKANDGGENDE